MLAYVPELNASEMQIALMVAKGWTTERIAEEMQWSAASVRVTISTMYRLLGIDAQENDGRVQLANLVRERGWK